MKTYLKCIGPMTVRTVAFGKIEVYTNYQTADGEATLIAWPSSGGVTLAMAEDFAKNLAEAVKFVKNEGTK